MINSLTLNTEYKAWLMEVKTRIRQTQIKAALKVNTDLLNLYWYLGAQIVEKQEKAKWGDRLIPQLSRDLKEDFSQSEGFSERNLIYCRQWYCFYYQKNIITQQVVAQLEEEYETHILGLVTQIPWGHNLHIITKCKSISEALFYVQKTIQEGWSRKILEHKIDSRLYFSEGKSLTNFSQTLPPIQSDLASQVLKDPYIFDFIALTEKYNERELENALVDNITKFLLELGSGFAYVGRQVPLNVGGSEFFIDLLFFHLRLRCYLVVELKTTHFQPEYTGKLSFYLTAIDRLLRHPQDNPTIGLIICKDKNSIVAEYALQAINQPIGISEYELTKVFPEHFKGSLPTVQEIEDELKSTE
jgi:predicted nuclease of restriction endonuclease-like (RecB) superfamily